MRNNESTIDRILVVEDDPAIAEVLHCNLGAAGYSVTVVQDGLEALHAFDEQHPSLVTVDLNLPTVSGFRLVELFKRQDPRVPVIVVTASTFEEAEEVTRSGVADFVTKPFDPSQLTRMIDCRLRPAKTGYQPWMPKSAGNSRAEVA